MLAAAEKGAGIMGVYRVPMVMAAGEGGRENPEYGKATLMTSAFHRPNGLAFSPNGDWLYVADSVLACPSWTAFEIDNGNSAKAAAHGGGVAATTLRREGSFVLYVHVPCNHIVSC